MIHRPKSETIENIRNRFRKKPEWLLIQVTKTDPKTSTALNGKLLAHHPDRDQILRDSLKCKGPIMIDCSVKKLPQNYAVVF